MISDGDIEVIVAAATTRPEKLGLPFTRWSLRKLAAYLTDGPAPARIGRERLRQILHARGISFQRTRTWKESRDPDRDAKLDRIEHVTSHYPDRCLAFDQFGPLSIRPCHGICWAPRKRPARLRAPTTAKRWTIDLKKGMELGPWLSCIDRLATTPDQARALLADAVAILEARAALLAAHGRRVWDLTRDARPDHRHRQICGVGR